MSTGPGAMQFTRIPSPASSAAIDLVRYSSAAFDIPYTDWPGRTIDPDDELMLTTAFTGERRRWGSAAWTRKNGLLMLTKRCSSNSAWPHSSSGCERQVPALFTIASMRPSSATVRVTSSPAASGRERSQVTASAAPPAASTWCAASSSGSGRRPATTTAAPRPARATAAARPMPVPPPVTIATAPSRSLPAAVIGS